MENGNITEVVEKNGQKFDLGDSFEADCYQLGRHDFGETGQCRHCFRREDKPDTL